MECISIQVCAVYHCAFELQLGAFVVMFRQQEKIVVLKATAPIMDAQNVLSCSLEKTLLTSWVSTGKNGQNEI